MADEMEEMEARLAGYIDGTLPPAQRAEIEAYLKANPTHARLITELQSIKTAVGSLPKEKAPAEVLDTLQANLERHTLLENVEESAAPLRINRWPQLGAVAAVLLLTAGLGVLIYNVMPSGRPAQNDLALLTSSAASRPGDGEAEVVPNDGVSLNEAARRTAPGALPQIAANTPLATNNVESNLNNNYARQQGLNGVNNYARDEAQNNVQFGMATPQAQQPFNGGVAMGGGGVQPPESLADDRRQNLAKFKAETGAAVPLGADAAATPSDAVNVLLVRTEDPALTANLLIGGLVQENVRFARITPASTQPADAAAMQDVEAAIASLQQAGDLPVTTTARDLLLPARPLFVPAASAVTLTKLSDAAKVPGLGNRGVQVVSFTRTAEPAATQPAEARLNARLRRDAGPSLKDADKALSTSQPAAGYVVATPTTQTTYFEFAGQDRTRPADLYVLILHDTKPPASQPAVAAPATAPAASQPAAIGEMP